MHPHPSILVCTSSPTYSTETRCRYHINHRDPSNPLINRPIHLDTKGGMRISQWLLILTGNYNYFNILTSVLMLKVWEVDNESDYFSSKIDDGDEDDDDDDDDDDIYFPKEEFIFASDAVGPRLLSGYR